MAMATGPAAALTIPTTAKALVMFVGAVGIAEAQGAERLILTMGGRGGPPINLRKIPEVAPRATSCPTLIGKGACIGAACGVCMCHTCHTHTGACIVGYVCVRACVRACECVCVCVCACVRAYNYVS